MALSQARELLLSKVKADQERLKQLDIRTSEATEAVERMKQRLGDLNSDMKAGKKGEVPQNKVFDGGVGLPLGCLGNLPLCL